MSIELGTGLLWPKCLEAAINRLGLDRVDELITDIGYSPKIVSRWLVSQKMPVGVRRKRIRELFGWTYADLPPSEGEFDLLPGSYTMGEHGDSYKYPGHKLRLMAHTRRIEKEMGK